MLRGSTLMRSPSPAPSGRRRRPALSITVVRSQSKLINRVYEAHHDSEIARTHT